FVAVRADGAVLLRQRPPTGLLGGMTEVPGSHWTARQDGATDISAAPFPADWRETGSIRHVFTHFALELSVFRADLHNDQLPGDQPPGDQPPGGGWWSSPDTLPGEALPTVMKKAIEAAIPGATRKPRKG
ncbi:NUDIX domain-containing protein, partial [Nitratireductor aquibiodomus]|uniref:NUDIX domain-containing protein n=1 Tax=Nitratireductor aquibiodomus TaxID=204799 RepID=UPI000560C246